VVEQRMLKGTWKLQSFKKCQKLGEIQEYHKENQMYIFWCQNLRNYGKKKRPLRAYELGQEA